MYDRVFAPAITSPSYYTARTQSPPLTPREGISYRRPSTPSPRAAWPAPHARDTATWAAAGHLRTPPSPQAHTVALPTTSPTEGSAWSDFGEASAELQTPLFATSLSQALAGLEASSGARLARSPVPSPRLPPPPPQTPSGLSALFHVGLGLYNLYFPPLSPEHSEARGAAAALPSTATARLAGARRPSAPPSPPLIPWQSPVASPASTPIRPLTVGSPPRGT